MLSELIYSEGLERTLKGCLGDFFFLCYDLIGKELKNSKCGPGVSGKNSSFVRTVII